MQKLPILKIGDYIEIIAPASRCSDERLSDLIELLSSWQLNCIVQKDIFGDDLLCSNSDEQRFMALANSLQNPKTKAIICARGGYGSARLIPALSKIIPPAIPKLFAGMSDLTSINLYLQHAWGWPTLHGVPARDKFSPESIAAFKAILFGEIRQIELFAVPLNKIAEKNTIIETVVTGGNLSLVQASIGTIWQINGENKIIFLEDVGERGYRIDRMLEHLRQANIFKNVSAILFGDFVEGKEPNGSSLVNSVLERFAESCEIPVVKVEGLGHGYTNFPIPLGTNAKLNLGKKVKFTCFR